MGGVRYWLSGSSVLLVYPQCNPIYSTELWRSNWWVTIEMNADGCQEYLDLAISQCGNMPPKENLQITDMSTLFNIW